MNESTGDGFSEDESRHYGTATTAMVESTFAEGVDRAVLLIRHSARTFDAELHDLENRLTGHGRALCRQFGAALPKNVHVRGYASPPERCMETARLVIDAHAAAGGSAGRTRPVEGLGVFYALDQQKMWMVLRAAGGLPAFLSQWFAGDVPTDAMMPAPLAVEMVMRVLRAKLHAPGDPRQLDLCVSHDMTVFTVRHGVGLEPLEGPTIEFLDGLLLFEREGRLLLRSQHGGEVVLTTS